MFIANENINHMLLLYEIYYELAVFRKRIRMAFNIAVIHSFLDTKCIG